MFDSYIGRNRFKSSIKPRKTKVLFPSRLESKSNMFEAFMSTLLKIVFPSNKKFVICMNARQLLF